MSWRLYRQFGAVLVLLIFLGIFTGVTYWRFRPPPTCFDNKKNQNELAVDCGGSNCKPCELKNPKDVAVIWTRAVPIRQNVYDVAAFVRNSNEILAAPSLEYRFSLFDDVGLIAERLGETYLYPQERTYIIEANIPVSRLPTRVEFAITKSTWEIYKGSPPGILVQGKEYRLERETASTTRSVIDSELFNDTVFDFRTVNVNFLLFDKDENLVGVNKTIIERFLTRTTRDVRTVWPEAISDSISSIIIEPRVNVFNPIWLLRSQ
jgi:cbb3-type cytochrome oxidase subunit 3